MKKLIGLLILIFHFGLLWCQSDTTQINVLAKINESELKIRWACNNPIVWLNGLKYGYILEKGTINSSNNFIVSESIIIQKWPDTKISSYIKDKQNERDTSNLRYIRASMELSKASGGLRPNASFEDAMKFKEQQDLIFGFATIASLMDWDAALLQGIAYTDKSTQKDIVYRISPNFKIGNLKILPGYITRKNFINELSSNVNIDIYEGDRRIDLSWKKNEYILATSVDFSRDGNLFNVHNTLPKVQLNSSEHPVDSVYYSVDSLENYKMFYFKVYGHTIFGDKILLNTVKGMPRDLTPPPNPIMLGVQHKDENVVEINWSFDSNVNDISGFIIARGNEKFGNFNQIHDGLIPPDWRSFEDIYFDRDTVNYYLIEAIDTSGNRSRSSSAYLTFVDNKPPLPPKPISGIMDSLGIVTLTLNAQKEKDFMGYRLYKANAPDHEFSVVQETYNDTIVSIARHPVLIDTSTLESLTKYVYYKVTALDYHYNESKFSEVIKVPRPDKYPPVPPLINAYNVSHDKIVLGITVSSSQDAIQNYICRKKESETKWIVIDSIGIRDTSYTDISPENNVPYEYAARAKDESGLISEMGNVVRLQTYYKPRPLDMDINCTYFPKNNLVLTTWVYKEKISDDLTLSFFNPADKPNAEKGFIRSNTQLVYTFKYQTIPDKIKIKAQTSEIEFLPTLSNTCIINQSDINENEVYKKYKGIK